MNLNLNQNNLQNQQENQEALQQFDDPPTYSNIYDDYLEVPFVKVICCLNCGPDVVFTIQTDSYIRVHDFIVARSSVLNVNPQLIKAVNLKQSGEATEAKNTKSKQIITYITNDEEMQDFTSSSKFHFTNLQLRELKQLSDSIILSPFECKYCSTLIGLQILSTNKTNQYNCGSFILLSQQIMMFDSQVDYDTYLKFSQFKEQNVHDHLLLDFVYVQTLQKDKLIEKTGQVQNLSEIVIEPQIMINDRYALGIDSRQIQIQQLVINQKHLINDCMKLSQNQSTLINNYLNINNFITSRLDYKQSLNQLKKFDVLYNFSVTQFQALSDTLRPKEILEGIVKLQNLDDIAEYKIKFRVGPEIMKNLIKRQIKEKEVEYNYMEQIKDSHRQNNRQSNISYFKSEDHHQQDRVNNNNNNKERLYNEQRKSMINSPSI
eukprot:403349085